MNDPIVPFSQARPGDHAYTYEDPKGLIADYGWVTDLEFFDERDGEVALIRKRWVLMEVEVIVLPDPYPVEDD